MKKRHPIQTAFVLIVPICLAMAGCALSGTARTAPGVTRVLWVDEGLQVLEVKRINSEAGTIVRGTVLNTSARVLTSAEVVVTFIDAIGRPISRTTAKTSMVEPQSVWTWEAPARAEGVADFQVIRVARRY